MASSGWFIERLDPELVPFMETKPTVDLSDIPAARAGYNERMREAALASTPRTSVTTRQVDIARTDGQPDVTVRIHQRVGSASAVPALLWIHGGGHVMGVAVQDDWMLQDLVNRLGCVAVAVEWRYAPENPYPASIEDCWTALNWVASNANDLGIDPARIVVGGASSGGGVAAGLTLLNRDRGGPSVAAQILDYPMLDDREVNHSSRVFTDERAWNAESNRLGWDAYLGGIDRSEVPVYAAPGRATDLEGVPPTWIGALELDPLVDDAVAFAQTLMKSGVSTELHVFPGAIHAIDAGLPRSSIGRRYIAERTAAFDRWLSS